MGIIVKASASYQNPKFHIKCKLLEVKEITSPPSQSFNLKLKSLFAVKC